MFLLFHLEKKENLSPWQPETNMTAHMCIFDCVHGHKGMCVSPPRSLNEPALM